MLSRNTPYTVASNLAKISDANAKESFDTPRIVKENVIIRGHMALIPSKFESHYWEIFPGILASREPLV